MPGSAIKLQFDLLSSARFLRPLLWDDMTAEHDVLLHLMKGKDLLVLLQWKLATILTTATSLLLEVL